MPVSKDWSGEGGININISDLKNAKIISINEFENKLSEGAITAYSIKVKSKGKIFIIYPFVGSSLIIKEE